MPTNFQEIQNIFYSLVNENVCDVLESTTVQLNSQIIFYFKTQNMTN